MLQPGAKQGPSPASGLNAYTEPIDSSVPALHLVWHENKPSARVWLGRRRTHQRKVTHTRGRRHGRRKQSSVHVVPETNLDTVKTATVGTDCSRLSNQCSRGESPWKHRRRHRPLCPSPQLEPEEHCVCTQNDLWVLNHGTLLSGVKRDWSSETGSAHCSLTHLARSAASSEAAGELGCTLCVVPAPLSLGPFGLQLLCQG